MTAAFVIEQCSHGHDYTACQRCALSPAVSATRERCRCPNCREWRRASRGPRPDRLADDSVPCSRLRFDVVCPRCEGPVRFLARSHPHPYESRAVLHCPSCHVQHVVVVVVLGESGNPLRPLEGR